MSTFTSFQPAALKFLRQLKRNNNREWFAANKQTFEDELLAPMRLFVEEMDVRCASFAPEIIGDPKRSIFRIYRDVRFSKDKSPYKTHGSFWMTHQSAGHGVGSETHGAGAGFYFHLEPNVSLVAGGVWMPPRDRLALIRESLLKDHRPLERALSGTAFKRRFSRLSEEGMLKRTPRGVDPDHPAAEYLRRVSFTVSAPISNEDVTSKSLADRVEKDFRLMLPFVRWLNSSLGYPPKERR